MTETDTPQAIVDRSDLRKWFSMVPNLVDDSDLDPYESRLLHHYYRVGNCNEGLLKTAEKCRMSTGKVSQARTALWSKGWINLEKYDTPTGPGFVVTVADKWEENFAFYSERKRQASSGEGYSPHQVRPKPSPHEGQPSPHEGKNKQNQEGTEAEGGAPPLRHPALAAYRAAARINPAKAAEAPIIKAVGEVAADVAYWKEIVTAWVLSDYNPGNVAGMLECFNKKQMPGTRRPDGRANGNGHAKPAASNQGPHAPDDPIYGEAAVAKAKAALSARKAAA